MELLGELWSSMAITGKGVVLVLAGLSIYSYGVMIDRGLALRWTRDHSSRFAAEVGEESLSAEAVLSRANSAQEQGYCSLATVVGAGLSEYQLLREEDQTVEGVLEGWMRRPVERWTWRLSTSECGYPGWRRLRVWPHFWGSSAR